MKPFRPMLADKADITQLNFPLMASSKLDGIRALVRDGVVYSRNNKPIPNQYVQDTFRHLDYYDGELIVGSPTSSDCYRATMSGVMSEGGAPNVKYYVFDHYEKPDEPYSERYFKLKPAENVVVLPQYFIKDAATLEQFEGDQLKAGYEGIIVRGITAPYKQGRSSVNEGYMLKLKRFLDAEYKVIGFKERMHNANVPTLNELGLTRHSSHKANKIPRGDLGALIVAFKDGTTFDCGSGFTDAERVEIWQNRDKYLGQLAKIKYLPVGMKDLPRHPIFLGWRSSADV